MTVKELKKHIKDMPDDREILLASWKNDRTSLAYTYPCCNPEFQEKVNQLWFSTEGLRVQ